MSKTVKTKWINDDAEKGLLNGSLLLSVPEK